MTIRGGSNMMGLVRVRMYSKLRIGTDASGANSSLTLVYHIAIAINGKGLQQMRMQAH